MLARPALLNHNGVMRNFDSLSEREILSLAVALEEEDERIYGDFAPLTLRQDVKGFVNRKPVWLIRPLPLDIVRRQASSMELETQNFYRKAAARASDTGIRQSTRLN